MANYQFTKDAPVHTVMVLNPETKLYSPKQVVGLTPFGKQTGVLTEDKLSDSVAEYLSTKPEWAKFIEAKQKAK